MNFAELSAQRYSLRKFSHRPVEDALLQQVLEAGRNAPTAHNNQPQRIFVLQSPEAMAKADACMGATSIRRCCWQWPMTRRRHGTGRMTGRTTARSTPPSP